MGLAKAYGQTHMLTNPHKYSKISLFNCGSARCFMCGNPRKVFKEKTMQERRFDEKVKKDGKVE